MNPVQEITTQEFKMALIDAFSEFPQVKEIYLRRLKSEIQVLIVLAAIKYDDDLLTQLLSQEYDFHKNRKETEEISSFHYLSAGSKVIGQLIYSKK